MFYKKKLALQAFILSIVLMLNVGLSAKTQSSQAITDVGCGDISKNLQKKEAEKKDDGFFGWLWKIVTQIFPISSDSTTFTTRNCKIAVFVAPVEKDSSDKNHKIAISFLEEMVTQYLKFPGFFYDIKMLCQNNQSFEPIVALPYTNSSDWSKLNTKENLKKIQDAKCDASAEDFKSVVQYIDDILKQQKDGKIILFIQIPWDKIDEQTKQNLKNRVNSLSNKQKIAGIYTFGSKGTSSGAFTEIFHDLAPNAQNQTATDDLEQIKAMVKIAKSQIEELK